MNIEQIMAEWEKDSIIDSSELSRESANIPIVHHKYYKEFMVARMQLKRAEMELKKLRFDKYEFYTQGPSPETPKEWKLPPIGRILKAEANTYVDNDPDVIKKTLATSSIAIKVDYLTDILKMISNRGYQIKGMIEWEKFKQGL